jgi:ParB family chromosome partitioning protein
MRGVCAKTPDPEETIMSDRTKVAAEAKTILFVPLNKLKKSPKDVRKMPHAKADTQALAASISALGTRCGQYSSVPDADLGGEGRRAPRRDVAH